MMQTVFHQKDNNYYLVVKNEEICCTGCYKELNYGDCVIIHHSWSKKSFRRCLWCNDCVDTADKMLLDFYFIAVVISQIPANCVLVDSTAPALINSRNDMSVWEAAEMQIEDEEIIDNTRLAGTQSLDGAQIGKSPSDVPTLSNNEPTEAGILFLHALANAQPVIEMNKTQLLEERK